MVLKTLRNGLQRGRDCILLRRMWQGDKLNKRRNLTGEKDLVKIRIALGEILFPLSREEQGEQALEEGEGVEAEAEVFMPNPFPVQRETLPEQAEAGEHHS